MRNASRGSAPGLSGALLVVRVIAGLLIAYHGLLHVQGGVSGFAAFIDSLGFPASTPLAWIVIALELGGGIMLAVGVLARAVGGLLALEMLITGIYVKIVKGGAGIVAASDQPGTGAELDFLFMAAFLAVLLVGAGEYSLDSAMGLERSGPGGQSAAYEPSNATAA